MKKLLQNCVGSVILCKMDMIELQGKCCQNFPRTHFLVMEINWPPDLQIG